MNSVAQKHPSVIRTTSPNVHLRHVQVGDAPEIAERIEESRDHLSVHMGWLIDQFDPDATPHRIPKVIAAMNKDEFLSYGIIESSTSKMVGLTEVFGHDKVARCAQMGIWVTPGAEGKGYATAAGLAITSYAFDAWDLRQITASIKEANERSQKGARRNGARPDSATYFNEERGAQYRVWRLNR